jgi:hypothetical protein
MEKILLNDLLLFIRDVHRIVAIAMDCRQRHVWSVDVENQGRNKWIWNDW